MSPAPVKPEEADARPKLRLRDVTPAATVSVPDSLKSISQGGKGNKRSSASAGSRGRPAKAPAQKGHAPLHVIRFRRYGAWAMFFALGGAMWAMRYEGWLNVEQDLVAYGPWVILFMHGVITVIAAREDLFLGALCVLIPGYSLYFLLARSGRAWLCALTCGLLVGLGQDSWYALQEVSTDFYDDVNRRIAGGG